MKFLSGHQLTLLQYGAEFFPALVAAIDHAQHEVLLETYIFYDDPAGQQVAQALCNAAMRGVRVQLIVDWAGTREYDGALRQRMCQAGVQVRVYNRFYIGKQGLTRTHRKLAVIDAAEGANGVAFIGGINITDDYFQNFSHSLNLPRWDFAVRVQGPAVLATWHACQQQWRSLAKLSSLERYVSLPVLPARTEPQTNMQAGLVLRDNFRFRRTIERAYLQAIGQARKEVLMANPYFFPGRKFQQALIKAAQRGVRVTLLLGKKDKPLQDLATEALYARFLQNGIHIYEYTTTLLHAKVAVIDELWATVGSSNCDGLSLLLNLEANLIVHNPIFARNLREKVMQSLKVSQHITVNRNQARPLLRRAANWCAFVSYRILMRVATIW